MVAAGAADAVTPMVLNAVTKPKAAVLSMGAATDQALKELQKESPRILKQRERESPLLPPLAPGTGDTGF